MRHVFLATIAVLVVSLVVGGVGAATQPTPAAAAAPPFPRLLTEVRLTAPDIRLQDLAIDRSYGHLYVTDSEGRLHILDAESFDEITTLPGAGELTLDARASRLYASTRDGQEGLTVVDTAGLRVVGTISPGGQVAIDRKRGRLYIGNPLWGDPPQGTPGVRVYDAETLQQIGEIAQPGLPTYNPLRDELVIVGYTAYLADPDTLEVTADLLPEITAQPLRWCNGCMAVRNTYVFPARRLLMVDMAELSAGKGPGTLPAPRFFDAATLEEITDPTAAPSVEHGCEGRIILGDPVNGRVYRGEIYSRYESFNNLLVYDLTGNLLTWRDGLSLGVVNERTNQMYMAHYDDVLVLDLDSLSPLGTLPTGCIHTVEAGTGQLYGFDRGKLSIFAETGDRPKAPRTAPVGALPAEEIAAIQPSPNYAWDGTLFVMMSGQLFRSTDGGGSWVRLRGGLPEGYWLSLELAASPDFATDGTLFAGGFRGSFWGEGVYRSTDRGDTWRPMWNGLTHLRVYQVAISPNYATDRTLIAYSRFQMIKPDQSGQSVFRSTDGGQSWTLEMTQPQGNSMPAPAYLLPIPANMAELSAPAMRASNFAEGVERTFDGGATWQPAVIPGQPKLLFVKAVLLSPDRHEPDTYYVIAEAGLFRTPDRGETWQRCLDERLAGRDELARRITAGATSPWLDQAGYQIFIGTAAGEFLVLDPYAAAWQDLSARPKPPRPTPTPTAPAVVSTLCQSPVADRLSRVYADPRVSARLRCPIADGATLWAAYEPFERGAMIWMGDTRTIAVLYSTGAWAEYPDTWDEGQPSSDPRLTPPAGLHQPVRGFGKLWREQLGGPQSAIGWALGPENGYDILKQEFERGTMLAGPEGVTYVLYADGGWEGR